MSWRLVRRVVGGLTLVVVGYLAAVAHRPLSGPRRVGRSAHSGQTSTDPRDHRGRRRPNRSSPKSCGSCWRRGPSPPDSIGLRAKQSFTTFSQLDHDTLVLVLSGAYRDKLASYTWWFPIVGRVPYKGYFDFAAARRALRDRSTSAGFDVYLRPSPAFSTLGWFNDPLLSTSLGADTLDLANTVDPRADAQHVLRAGTSRVQ